MAVSIEEFVQHLESSEVLTGDEIEDFIPPQAFPKDAVELARDLVRKQKLTRFQADEVLTGKGKSLVLGNYVLLEKIGAGGMGQVFKARHRVMERLVAVKVLPAALTRDQAAIARFQREVKAAAKISHSNIVTAHDADQANGVHFLVMELVEGSDLSVLVKQRGPLSVGKAVDYVLQAARGLDAAHRKGIIHRDIKPANLLVDNEGRVKILDMGLARLSFEGDEAPHADLTATGMIMGTVDFMAPEQALDTKSADARADIYALGCTLYFLLSGRSTYDGDTLMKKLLAHREQPIPALRAVRPEIPEQLEAVFRKFVAKNVTDRYQSMVEAIVELERCWPVSIASATSQQPATTTFEYCGLDVRKQPPEEATVLAGPQIQAPVKKVGNRQKLTLIGFAGLGLVILAVIVIFRRNIESAMIAEIDQPAAKSSISQNAGNGMASLSVDTGKHRDQVEKASRLGTHSAVADGAKKPLFFQTRGYEAWAREVAALPAEKQVEAVSKKLMALNPGFDGKVTAGDGTSSPRIEDGVVTELGFVSDHVTDISPVRVLVGLKVLMCNGSRNESGRLSDLSPVEGMRLENLVFFFTQVSDLSPLRGVPLKGLVMFYSRVSDLTPLEGLPLEHFDCSGVPVTNLMPIAKCKQLKNLIVRQSKVTAVEVAALQAAIPDCKITRDDPAKPTGQSSQ